MVALVEREAFLAVPPLAPSLTHTSSLSLPLSLCTPSLALSLSTPYTPNHEPFNQVVRASVFAFTVTRWEQMCQVRGHPAGSWLTNPSGHLWRDKRTALSGPLSPGDVLPGALDPPLLRLRLLRPLLEAGHVRAAPPDARPPSHAARFMVSRNRPAGVLDGHHGAVLDAPGPLPPARVLLHQDGAAHHGQHRVDHAP